MKIEIINNKNILQNVITIDSFDNIQDYIYPDTEYIKILDIDIPQCKAQFLTNCEREFNIPISFRDIYRWIRVDISRIKNNKTELKSLLNIIYKHSC